MSVPFAWVDAFTGQPFAGNPAAVCIFDGFPADEVMQAIAVEFGVAETAFVSERRDGAGWDLRWFSPMQEVQLCGHGTLATAHALWDFGTAKADEALAFETLSGRLTATPLGDGWIELDFPARPVSGPADREPIAAALGAPVAAAWRVPEGYLVAELEAQGEVAGLRPDMDALAALDEEVLIVTAAGGGDGVDFVVRVFGPRWGVPEDAVTGSAQCVLAPYWSERLGKDRFLSHQLSARGGVLRAHLRGDRVGIAGQAVTVASGQVLCA